MNAARARDAWLRCLSGLLLALMSACAATSAMHVPKTPELGKHVLVRVAASADSNRTRPVYYMIRTLADEAGFSEGYDAALARALGEPLDTSVLARGLVQPTRVAGAGPVCARGGRSGRVRVLHRARRHVQAACAQAGAALPSLRIERAEVLDVSRERTK